MKSWEMTEIYQYEISISMAEIEVSNERNEIWNREIYINNEESNQK